MQIVLYPKVQIDTAIAVFLLKAFGEQKYPGIKEAPVAFWMELPEDKTLDELEAEGNIFVDLGGSRFDHHRLGETNRKYSASHLVAKDLGIETQAELQKLLEFARRDDLEGKGTLSQDHIDRAFGLSGLLSSLNKTYPGKPGEVLKIVMPFIHAHYVQERQKYETFPKEYEEAKKSGRAKEFSATQFGKQLKVVYIESDNPAIVGFIRSKMVGAHLVIQKSPTGHVNFISNQMAKLQLHKLARAIKLLEADLNNIILQIDSVDELERPGRTEGLPHWYYDSRANTLQNGGVNPQKIPPTKLKYEDIELAVKKSLNLSHEDDKFRKPIRRSHGAIIID